MPSISKRLSMIASFVPHGSKVCDVGTDHGYLAIELVKTDKANYVIATDIAEKPLKNAQKNIEKANVNNIFLRLCDGLSAVLPEETDTIVIAGMGGEVISHILDEGYTVAKRKNINIILQPTTSPEFLRRFLYENGYEIIAEKALQENGKLYSVMLVRYTEKSCMVEDFFYYTGKLIPDSEAAFLYIKKQQKRVQNCISSLENINEKKSDYLHYKSVNDGITELLKNFNGENSNGV